MLYPAVTGVHLEMTFPATSEKDLSATYDHADGKMQGMLDGARYGGIWTQSTVGPQVRDARRRRGSGVPPSRIQSLSSGALARARMARTRAATSRRRASASAV